jgi:pimeloyl-ACP methyl ester carboxylesterase
VLVSPVASSRRIRRSGFIATMFLRAPLPFAYAFAPVVARVLGGPQLPPAGRAEIVREARRISPRELGRRLMDVLSTDLLPRLDSMKTPTLIVHGRRDRIVPLSAAEDITARIPAARLEVIPGASHLPYMSHSEPFNVSVGGFLDECLSTEQRQKKRQS